MECEQVAEYLPWLLNRTLGDEERHRIEEHLEGCPACRHELAETSFAGAVFQRHVSTEQLVAHVFGETLPNDVQSFVVGHLENCGECADELELIRASRRAGSVLPWPGRQHSAGPAWQWGALAASLLFGVVGTLGWWRSESRELGRITQLETRISELESPRLNAWVEDVYPSDVVLRETTAEATNKLVVPADVESLTAILSYANDESYPSFEVDLVDGDGRRQWTKQGLERQEAGDFTINLRIDRLPPGLFTLDIFGVREGSRTRVASYPIVLVREIS